MALSPRRPAAQRRETVKTVLCFVPDENGEVSNEHLCEHLVIIPLIIMAVLGMLRHIYYLAYGR